MKYQGIEIPKNKIRKFCKRNYIIKLSFFGSILREDFKPESDIDVLVEFDPDHIPGFMGLGRMEKELSDIFPGKKIDLRTPKELSRYFRDEVVAMADVQYAER